MSKVLHFLTRIPMKNLPLLLVAVAAFSVAACTTPDSTTGAATTDGSMVDGKMADGDAMPNNADGKMASDGTAATDNQTPAIVGKADPAGPTGPHATDAEFMMTAAHSDQNEIQQSKMALAKGVTGMAKEMADKMIADHTKSTADLKVIAAKKGVKLPADMDAEHKAMVPAMQKMTGKEFEMKYLAQMQADHHKTANTMAAHEKMTQDADLKAFIGKTLPVVEQHLQMANKGADMKM